MQSFVRRGRLYPEMKLGMKPEDAVEKLLCFVGGVV